jgi:hypothetical protein
MIPGSRGHDDVGQDVDPAHAFLLLVPEGEAKLGTAVERFPAVEIKRRQPARSLQIVPELEARPGGGNVRKFRITPGWRLAADVADKHGALINV